MKVKIEKLTVTEVEVELPAECPGCGVTIGAPAGMTKLREHQAIGAVQKIAFVGDDVGESEGGEYDQNSDVAFVTGYSCTCGHVLATTEV